MKIQIFWSTSLFVFFSSVVGYPGLAQSDQAGKVDRRADFHWPEGKKMGLSLTFDDARISQVEKGIPLLDKYGIKATFYLSPENMKQRLTAWRNAVSDGHDIGNHTFHHPCSGNFDWSKDHALENYSLTEMSMELDSANNLIEKMLGIEPVSFAYPCGQTFTGKGLMTRSYIPLISAKFETGRGWLSEGPNDPAFCDMSQLTGIELDGKSFEQIKTLIEESKTKGMWLILAGHEMNDSGYQTSLLATIEAICIYVSDPANGIWTDNVHNIAAYIKKERREPPFEPTSSVKNSSLPSEH
jgi:peptidoglycan-N-acetylglucosamine deacetylase